MSVLSKAVALADIEGLSTSSSRALLQMAIKEMQKEAAKKSASDCSESDAVEDWDAEIEADNSASHKIHGTAGKFQFGRSNHADGEGEESVLPLRHQVLKQLTKATVTRVTKFPKPSIMWSMRLSDGRRSMSEAAFLNWIKDYVAARADSSVTLRTRDGSEAEQSLPYASHGFQVSSEWALEYLLKTYSMYRLGNIDESWRALQSFFIILLTSAKHHDELDAEEAFDRAAIFRCAYHLLRYGGKMWLPSRSSEFKGFLASCRAYALGVNTIVLDVLEQQVLGHRAHLSPTDMASIPSHLAGQFLAVCALVPDMIPVFLSVNSDVREGAASMDSVSTSGVGGGAGDDKKGKGHVRQKSVEQFPSGLGIAVSSSKSKRKQSHDGASPVQNAPVYFALQPIEILAEALLALVLLEAGHSPLSCDALPEGRVFQLTNIVLPAQKPHAQAGEQHLALEELAEKLRLSEYRVLLLLKISTLLSATSMVRARALYACSLFYFSRAVRNRQQQGGTSAPLRLSDKNDAVLCEQVLFEALYIAFTANAPFAGCVPSVSSFAEAALLKFGDVLLFLGKYTFAIGSYESCIMAHQLRTSRDHHELNRRLAGICLQHGDEARALSFYQKVLARAREGLNSDEIYFLSEKTADLYMDQGEFSLAEEQLASVIAACEINVNSGTGGHLKVDNTFLRLQLKHCAIQLLSSDPSRAAGVVETLVCCALPHGKRGQVLQFLADIYLKNSWQRECFGVLRLTLRDHPAIKLSAPTIMSVAMGKQKVEGIQSSLYESAARCCLKGGLLLEGLEWINRALMCKDAREGTLVRAYRLFIRGKILSQLSSPTQLVIFPTQLKCTRGSWSAAVKESRDGSYGDTSADHELFCSVAEIEAAVVAAGGDHPSVPETMNCSSAASIIHYALDSLKHAYEIYQPLGDTLKMTKCLIAVAELRLDSIFSVCALSGMSLHQALLDNMVVQPESGRMMSAQERLNVRNEYLRSIDEPSRLGLDLAVSLWDVGLVLRGLLCMAESRYLHSDVSQARLYWSEAKDLFFYCFIGSTGEILIADAPTPYLKKMMRIFTRCLRFLMCCEPEYIHRHRLLMDVHIRFEHVIRRSEHIFSGNATESFSSLASLDVVPEEGINAPTSIFTKQKNPSWGKSSFGSGSGRSRIGSKLFSTTFPPNQHMRTGSGSGASIHGANTRMQTFSMNLIWKSLHCCRVVCDKMKRGAMTADESRASNLLTLQAMIQGLQHTRVASFPKHLFRGKGSSEGPEAEVLYALQFDDVIAFVPPPPLRPMTHIFGGRRGHVFSVLHNSSNSLNVNLHGLTVVPGSKEQDKQQHERRQQQEQQQKTLRDAGGGADVSAFSDDFQQFFQATFMSADVLRLITHWSVVVVLRFL